MAIVGIPVVFRPDRRALEQLGREMFAASLRGGPEETERVLRESPERLRP